MNISQYVIVDLWCKLEKMLTCPSLLPVYDDPSDPSERAWQVKDRNIQFIVYVEDTLFRVVIDENGTQKPGTETDDPKKVIQVAKKFKSKYLSDS